MVFLSRKIWLLSALFIATFAFSACSLTNWHIKAGLQVVTNDVPSGIYLDGKFLDSTPYLNEDIQPGDYTLEIRPNDPSLTPYTTSISLKKGVLTVVVWKPGTRPETSGGVLYEMEKLNLSQQSQLSILTIPDSAVVLVDGENKGFAPTFIENIQPGDHEYEVSAPSYETQKHTIHVLAGYRMNVTVKLAKVDLESNTASASATVSATSVPVIIAPSAATASPLILKK